MNLNEYPQAIALTETELYTVTVSIDRTRKSITRIELEIDTQIAFNCELKNDAQRKAKRAAMLDQHTQHWEYTEFLEEMKSKEQAVLIELHRLRGEFSVLKLAKREEIARLELQANN
jgi:hypothetical protein